MKIWEMIADQTPNACMRFQNNHQRMQLGKVGRSFDIHWIFDINFPRSKPLLSNEIRVTYTYIQNNKLQYCLCKGASTNDRFKVHAFRVDSHSLLIKTKILYGNQLNDIYPLSICCISLLPNPNPSDVLLSWKWINYKKYSPKIISKSITNNLFLFWCCITSHLKAAIYYMWNCLDMSLYTIMGVDYPWKILTKNP